MILAVHVLSALLTVCGPPDEPADAGQISIATFESSSDAEKRKLLDNLTTRLVDAPSVGVIVSIIERAISDNSPEIRERGLSLLASRVGAPRFSSDPAVLSVWRREIPRLRQFRASIEAALKDGDKDVRDAAVLALGNLDVSESSKLTVLTVDPRTVMALAEAFRAESEPAVRASIVQSLALTTNRSKQVSAVLIDAMRDNAIPVRQAATRGLLKVDSSEALPVLVSALADDDKEVRINSARVIGQFGKTAAHLSDVLEGAAIRENDPASRAEIQRIAKGLRPPK